jgi:phosphoenolpyruvate carboxykinase (GTP)
MATIKKNTIFTNVLLKPDKTIWWEDGDEPPPQKGIDWRGLPWKPGMVNDEGGPLKGAHPNSRFTAPAKQCPSISYRLDHHHGVPIAAIIFGGRRAHVAPLVYEAFNWNHGVYIGATMASERTAAQFGKLGEVRRDPMAMLPFCGYNMAYYFKHWIEIGKRLKKSPKIFHINWFRQGKDGKFLWPGYGENLRVLEWILDRCNKKVKAKKTPIGYIPYPHDIDMTGLDIGKEKLHQLLTIDAKDWEQELEGQKQFLSRFKKDIPHEIEKEHQALKRRFGF